MVKRISHFICLLMISIKAFAQIDSLNINYYDNYPYAYTEGDKIKGIEIDIMREYVSWLKQKKNITVQVKYKAFTEFGSFYTSVKNGGASTVGLGSVTDNVEREKEVLFSPAYLQNVPVLVTDGTIPTLKTKEATDVARVFGNLSALVVSKSSHVNYMNAIKNSYIPNLKISFTEKQNNVLESIVSNKTVFGYVDLVAYWAYLKNNPSRFLKMQKVFNGPKEFLGFIMPKNSLHNQYLSEFFESGFGFTSTKVYHQILEQYLGYEIIESVEIK